MQPLLGHSRLDTTAIHLQVEPGDLRAAMDRHPLSRMGAQWVGARDALRAQGGLQL